METARHCAINLYESFLRQPDKRKLLVDGLEAFLIARDAEVRREAMDEAAKIADARQIADRERYQAEADWTTPYAFNRVIRASMDIAAEIRRAQRGTEKK